MPTGSYSAARACLFGGAFLSAGLAHAQPSFEGPVTATSAYGPWKVFPVDLNEDGLMDVVWAQGAVGGNLRWARNNGGSPPTFTNTLLDASVGYAQAVFPVDIDGDGDIDIVRNNRGDIGWLENNGAEAFTFRTIDTGQAIRSPTSVFVEDLDGDGDPDIAATFKDEGKLSWFENRILEGDSGPDGFGSENVIASQYLVQAMSVFAADMDRDGQMDLLTASAGNGSAFFNYVSLYMRSKFPPFDFESFPTLIDDDLDVARAVFPADIDGDGDLDVVAAGAGSGGTLRWYEIESFGPGIVEVQATHTIAAGNIGAGTGVNDRIGLFVADLDGDSDPDIALSLQGGTGSTWWFENQLSTGGGGSDGFIARQISTTFGGPSIAAADFDNDGDEDLVSASGSIRWWPNDGASVGRTVLNEGDGRMFGSIADAAANALDGSLLLAGPSSFSGAVDLGIGDGKALTLDSYRPISNGASILTASLGEGDVLQATRPEQRAFIGDAPAIVLSADQPDGSLTFAFADFIADAPNGAEGATIRGERFSLDFFSSLMVAPFTTLEVDTPQGVTNTGALDIGIGATALVTGDLILDLDAANGVNAISGDDGAPGGPVGLGGVYSVDAADIDGDGTLDVIGAGSVSNRVVWWSYDAMAGPIERVITTNRSGPRSVAAADLDGDGDTDVVTASFYDDTIAWHENDGAPIPVFTERLVFPGADGAQDVAIGDLNGDGAPDIVSASREDDTVRFHLNSGTAVPNFTTGMAAEGLDGPFGVAIGDVTGDGLADIVCASALDGAITLLVNIGGSPPAFFPVTVDSDAEGARDVALGDLDGDGDLDIAAAALTGGELAWYENQLTRGGGGLAKRLLGLPFPPLSAPVSVAIGDGDNDGDMDIYALDVAADNVWLFEQTDDAGVFVAPREIGVGSPVNHPRSLVVRDLNGDGVVDLLYCGEFDPDGAGGLGRVVSRRHEAGGRAVGANALLSVDGAVEFRGPVLIEGVLDAQSVVNCSAMVVSGGAIQSAATLLNTGSVTTEGLVDASGVGTLENNGALRVSGELRVGQVNSTGEIDLAPDGAAEGEFGVVLHATGPLAGRVVGTLQIQPGAIMGVGAEQLVLDGMNGTFDVVFNGFAYSEADDADFGDGFPLAEFVDGALVAFDLLVAAPADPQVTQLRIDGDAFRYTDTGAVTHEGAASYAPPGARLVAGSVACAATSEMRAGFEAALVTPLLDCAIDDSRRFGMRDARLILDGPGSSRSVEAMSLDQGPNPAGLDPLADGAFPIGLLIVESGTADIVDLYDNATASPTAEAVYVDALVVRSGATLNTNGLRVYYNELTLDGAVDDAMNLIPLGAPDACAGDADGDGAVGFNDLLVVIIGYGSLVDVGEGPSAGDVDRDRYVGLRDLNLVLINFGAGCE